ncbi:hypothetical protein M378DRAFT_15143 [Amanita muscaria Koide BX008]|uniref:Uncharacterized protein n=1 Tax=Amanita muscaria (strain Koide BX008) TaxID=946122 RepID=A0A0C2SXU8_AMAMK|nr:hypothetical protein M378DRAFT_15143 [Amanita muscaria Koide BX008]
MNLPRIRLTLGIRLHYRKYWDLWNFSHNAVPAESVATPHVMQSTTIVHNAQCINTSHNSDFQNIGSVTDVYGLYGGGNFDGLEFLNGFILLDAQFDSFAQDPDRQCILEHVLKRLRDWVDNPKMKERIFWLCGPAGTGITTWHVNCPAVTSISEISGFRTSHRLGGVSTTSMTANIMRYIAMRSSSANVCSLHSSDHYYAPSSNNLIEL